MHCFAFRRALSLAPGSWPGSWDEELRAHARQCRSCEAFARRLSEFESTLTEAVRLDVPEGLASRLLLAHGLREKLWRRSRRRRLVAFAAAAALVLAASWLALAPVPLDDVVIAHIEAEPSHLHARGELSPAEVDEALAPLGIGVDGDLPPIHYAGTCWIRRHLGAHLVLQGERGPITVLYLPGARVDERLSVGREGLQGIVVPVGGGGLAIVAEPGEDLEVIERRVKRALRLDPPQIARSGGGPHF